MGAGPSVLQPPANVPSPARARERFLIHLSSSSNAIKSTQLLQSLLSDCIEGVDQVQRPHGFTPALQPLGR